MIKGADPCIWLDENWMLSYILFCLDISREYFDSNEEYRVFRARIVMLNVRNRSVCNILARGSQFSRFRSAKSEPRAYCPGIQWPLRLCRTGKPRLKAEFRSLEWKYESFSSLTLLWTLWATVYTEVSPSFSIFLRFFRVFIMSSISLCYLEDEDCRIAFDVMCEVVGEKNHRLEKELESAKQKSKICVLQCPNKRIYWNERNCSSSTKKNNSRIYLSKLVS